MRLIHSSLMDSSHKGPVIQRIYFTYFMNMKKILNCQLSWRWSGMLSCSCDVTVMTYHSSLIKPGREYYDQHFGCWTRAATELSHQHPQLNSVSIPKVLDQSCKIKIIILQVTWGLHGMRSEITLLKWLPHLSGANELMTSSIGPLPSHESTVLPAIQPLPWNTVPTL